MTVPKPTRRKTSRQQAGSSRSRGKQSAAGLEALQRDYASAQAECATTATEAIAALNNRVAETQAELLETIRGLWTEVAEGGETAARSYPERVQAALNDQEAADRCSKALQTYVDGLREFAASRSAAEQAARESYQEYANAVQRGEPEDEMRARAEETQQAYLDALRASSPGGDSYRKVAEAGAAYEDVVRETRTKSLEAIAEAVRDYAGSTQSTLDQGELPQRYEAAVQRCEQRVTDLTGSAQRTLLEAHIRALGVLQAGWAKVAGSAASSDGGAAGASQGGG